MTDPESRVDAVPDRFCDLVMKGGVTSGILYPGLIERLARKYRFKSIGGTSAGAIASVAAAAAEYQRRTKHGSMAGFDQLAALPTVLQQKKGDSTRLLRLFQPDPSCAKLFRVLVGILNRSSARRAAIFAFAHAVAAYAWAAVVAAIVACGSALLLGGTWFAWVVSVAFALVGLTLAVAFLTYRDATRNLVANDYGLCSGLSKSTTPEDAALTPWLHRLIQECAGLDPDRDAPLTFAQLWDAPGEPAILTGLPAHEKRSIDLRMFTTNLHHGRPYLLPHDGAMERLFFREADLRRVLPPEVVAFMVNGGVRYEPKTPSEPQADEPQIQEQVKDLYELRPDNFPVLLAARMSLSFPLLLSTVRLWVVDFDFPQGQRKFRCCSFSDGGLCSNFPIHLFDGLLPGWPTFGIQLEPMPDPKPPQWGRLFLPASYKVGYGERWNHFDGTGDSPAKLFGFLGALIQSMQNWNDNSLARMPGVRDRVVRVRLKPNEGGLNLNMDPDLIATVSGLGTDAGDALVERFVDGNGWQEQQLIRVGVLVKVLEERLRGLRRVWALAPHSGYAALLQNGGQAPPGFAAPLAAGSPEVAALAAIMRDVEQLAQTIDQQGRAYGFTSVPQTALRVRPSI